MHKLTQSLAMSATPSRCSRVAAQVYLGPSRYLGWRNLAATSNNNRPRLSPRALVRDLGEKMLLGKDVVELEHLAESVLGEKKVSAIIQCQHDDLRVLDGLGGSPSAQFTPKVLTRQSRLDLQIRPHQFFQGQTTGGLTLLYFTILSLTHS